MIFKENTLLEGKIRIREKRVEERKKGKEKGKKEMKIRKGEKSEEGRKEGMENGKKDKVKK